MQRILELKLYMKKNFKSSIHEYQYKERLGTSLKIVPDATRRVSISSPHNRIEYKRHLSSIHKYRQGQKQKNNIDNNLRNKDKKLTPISPN